MRFEGGEVAISHVRFRNDGGFTIASAITDSNERVTLVGVMPALYEGDVIHVEGAQKVHPQYGEQFEVSGIRREVQFPQTMKGVRQWLSSRLKWVGPKTAQRLLDRYGVGLWDTIETDPDDLHSIPWLTAERVDELVKTYHSYKDEINLRSWLYEIGLTERQADEAVKKWDRTRLVIEGNPYVLMWLPGIKFVDADAVATELGVQPDDPRRCEAAMVQVVQDRCKEKGHTYLPLAVALTLAGQLTRCGSEPLLGALQSKERCMGLRLVDNGHAVVVNTLYHAELTIAARVMGVPLPQAIDTDPADKAGKPVVQCLVEWTDLPGDYTDSVEGVVATCSRCDHEVEVYGGDDRSVTRALATMRDECPRGEDNYYEGEP